MRVDYFDDILDPSYRLKSVLYKNIKYHDPYSEIVFDFGAKNILLTIDGDSDEIKFDRDIKISKRYKKIENAYIESAYNSYAMWIWVMKNQQGYTDAFQIELADLYLQNSKEFIFQVKGLASSLILYSVASIMPREQRCGVKQNPAGQNLN